MMANYRQLEIIEENPTFPEHTLMIVGAPLEGPSERVFSLYPDMDPTAVLGDSPLADAYTAARRAGAESIMAYRINGIHGEAEIRNPAGDVVMTLRAVSATERSDEMSIIGYPTHLHIAGTDGTSRDYFFDRHENLNALAYAINQDAHFGLVECTAHVPGIHHYGPTADLFTETVDIIMAGGDSEPEYIQERNPEYGAMDISETAPMLLERLQQGLFGYDAEDIASAAPEGELGALDYGVLVLCDMFHDDDPGYAEALGRFAENREDTGQYGCITVLGTAPLHVEAVLRSEDEDGNIIETIDAEDVMEASRAETENLLAISQAGESEYFRYVQVVQGAFMPNNPEHRLIPAAYGYAATQAALPVHTMMTNKGISGAGQLNAEKSKEDIALLSQSGYICIIPSVRRGVVPYRAISHGWDGESLMARPHNLRIAQYVSHMLKGLLDDLVGNVQTALSIEEAMATVEVEMTNLIHGRIIRDFNLRSELGDGNERLDVFVDLHMFSEVESVEVIAQTRFPRGVYE